MVGKPWFQTELERVTGERWKVTAGQSAVSLRCSHGMKVFVPYPVSLERPFLNDEAEKRFVGKVLMAHRPWGEVKLDRWAHLSFG